MPISLISQSFPPKSKFNESNVPDLSGKVCIVTGGNTGIGKENVRVLLQHGAKVYLGARSEEKARAAIEDLKKVTGKTDADVVFFKLDLGSVKAAKAAAEEIVRKEHLLHILFNSAGVMTPPLGSTTSDSYDLQWGTNVLGHFVFTETLLPTLIATAAVSPPNTVRIVTTSSSAHLYATPGGVNLEDQTLGGKGGKGGMELYGQSKLGDIIIANHWADTLKASGIISVSVNPGNIRSELQRTNAAAASWIAQKFLLYPTPMGALTQLCAGTSPTVTMADSGAYFVPWARVDVPGRKEATDRDFGAKVIELLRKQAAAKL